MVKCVICLEWLDGHLVTKCDLVYYMPCYNNIRCTFLEDRENFRLGDPNVPHKPKFKCAMCNRKLKRAGFTEVLDFQYNHLRAECELNLDYKEVRRERKKKDKRNAYYLKRKIEKQTGAASSHRAGPSHRQSCVQI